MPTQEEIRAKELQKEIFFLEQKVQELSGMRSRLENDIAGAHEDYLKKLDDDYNTKVLQLNVIHEQRMAKLDEKQKYLDDYLVRLDKQASEQTEKDKILESSKSVLMSEVDNFSCQKELAVKEIEDKRRAIDSDKVTLDTASNGLKIQSMALANERINLDTKSLNIETAQININKEREKVKVIQDENDKVLEDVEHEKQLVEEEKRSIKELLDQIKVEKASMIELATYKDDLAKLEAEKTEFEAKKQELIKASSGQTKRENDILEREKATTEKEKYLEIKECDLKRDLDKKIAILTSLRRGDQIPV